MLMLHIITESTLYRMIMLLFINKISVMIDQEDVLQYFITERQIVFYMHVMNSMNMNHKMYMHVRV